MGLRLSRDYPLPPEDEAPLRKSVQKGVGATVLVILIVLGVALVAGGKPGDPLTLLRDILGAVAILLVINQYSRGVAGQRLLLAREYRKRNEPERVLAALLPFARSGGLFNRSRFDTTGEAHYLLAWSAKQCGETELLAYAKAFLGKFRRGQWAKKAAKL
ncbi:MAG TPA: hypothetical protein VGE01_14635 [Fimbriimonas sp.]